MENIRTLLRQAGRRLGATEFLRRLHWSEVIALGLALVLVLISKTIPAIGGSPVQAWFGPVLLGVGVVVAIAWWWPRRPSMLHVAVEVDDRLELREKLSSALLLSGREDPFAQAAVDDAIQVAKSRQVLERVRRGFPVLLPKQWWVSPILLVVTVVASWFLPQGDLFAREKTDVATVDRTQNEQVEQQVQEDLEQTARDLGLDVEEVKQWLEKDGADDGAPAEPETPEDAKRDAYKKYSALADHLQELVEGDKGQTLEALQEKLAQLGTNPDLANSKLAEAIAGGNFSQAKAELEKMMQDLQSGKMSDEEKAALAKTMEALADQMEKLAQANQALTEAMKRAGIDPSLASDPAALQQALQQAQNLTPEQRQQLAQMAQAMAQSSQICQSMASAASQCAGGLRNPGIMDGALAGGRSLSDQLTQAELLQSEMAIASARLQEALGQCQSLGQGMSMCQGSGVGAGQQWLMQMNGPRGRGPGMGGPGQGQGGRGNRFATTGQLSPETARAMGDSDAPIIGERFIKDGQLITGEAIRELGRVIITEGERAREELSEDRITKEYETSIQQYFGDMAKRTNADEPAEDPVPDESSGEGESKDGDAGTSGNDG